MNQNQIAHNVMCAFGYVGYRNRTEPMFYCTESNHHVGAVATLDSQLGMIEFLSKTSMWQVSNPPVEYFRIISYDNIIIVIKSNTIYLIVEGKIALKEIL